jgi:Spy/CpxP family protein refolding chaperone
MHPGFFGWWKKGCGPSAHGPEDHASHGRGCGPGHHHHWHGGGDGAFAGWHGGPPWGRGHGPGGGHGPHHGPPEHDEGGGFGVKRPLRFLAWKLELEEEQVKKLATILDDLKTERAQASVDNRRSIAGFAEAVESATFDEAKAKGAGDTRVMSAERLRDAVVQALSKIHAILDDEQRKRLAYLLRTGTLSI